MGQLPMNRGDKFLRFAETQAVREDIKRKSVRGALFMASLGGIDFLFRLISLAVLARLLVPEHFGLIAMVTAVTGILEAVKDLGLATATIQRHDITHRQVTNLFWVNALAGILFASFFCAASPMIANLYHDDRLVRITIAISMVFVWSGLSVQHEALMCRQMMQGELAFIRLLASVLSTILAIALALADWGYWALVWREVSRATMVTLGLWMRCPWIPGLPTTRAGTRSLLRFGRDLSYANFFYGVITNIDKLVVGKLFGATTLGGYRLANQLIATPIDQLIVPVNSTAHAGLSLLQRDPVRYRRYFEKVTFLVGLCSMPIAVFSMVYAEELTLVLLGQKWIGAAPFFLIFAASAFIRPVLGIAGVVLISCGQSRRLLTMTIATNLFFLLLVGIGSRWGAIGVAIAHVATPALLLLPNLWFAFAQSPVTIGAFFRAIRTPLVASSLMAAALIAFHAVVPGDGRLLTLCSGFAVGTVVYFVGCVLLPAGRAELRNLLADVAASLPTMPLRFFRRSPR